MTIAKRFLPLILVLSLLFCLTSCKGEAAVDSESDDALSMLLEIVDSVETTSEANYYVVVISAEASGALAQKAKLLSDKIEEITGVDSVLEYDNGDNPIREKAIEIILGNTDRNESRVALAELRDGDYVCKIMNGNIVIGGISDEDTVIAVERFMTDILPYSSAEQLMGAGEEFEHYAERKDESVLLCGFPISGFGLVCGADGELGGVAEHIAEGVFERCGVELSTVATKRDGVKEIILEFVESETYVGEGYIAYDGEDVTLRACDKYGIQAVAEYFCDLLLAGEQTDEICLVSSWVSRTVKCPNRLIEMEMISFDDQSAGFVTLDCVTAMFKEIDALKPQLALLSEMTEETWSIVSANIPQGYSYCTLGNDSVAAIIYDTQLLSLSVKTTVMSGFNLAEITLAEAGGAPSYDMAYIYSDDASDAQSIGEAISGIVNEKDLVLVEHAVSGSDDARLPAFSLMEGSRIHGSDGDFTYIDAISAECSISFENVSCENLKKNGISFGFLCRATRVSFHRAEFIA